MESAVELHGADRSVALVLGVARLGEAGLRGWWGCHTLDQAGEWVLSGSFPRTWRCAALELDLISATRRHHELLPRPTALHLFSDELPFRRLAAAWLAEKKTSTDMRLVDVLASWNAESAAASLGEWAGKPNGRDAKRVGPALCLGSLSPIAIEQDATRTLVCQRLAAAYVSQGVEFSPPYFDRSE